MMFSATAPPIATPKPPAPAPTPIATAAMMAVIWEVSSAVRLTFPPLVSVASVMVADVAVVISLRAHAPAPATPAPKVPAPTATDAAAETARMPGSSRAVSVMPPGVPLPALFVTVALLMAAVTLPSMRFLASETPTDTATPAVPPKAKASETAPAIAEMVDVSSALSFNETPSASLSFPLMATTEESPSTKAPVAVRMTFSTQTPAPLAPTPAVPPTATAADADTTSALIVWAAVAARLSTPSALTLERSR